MRTINDTRRVERVMGTAFGITVEVDGCPDRDLTAGSASAVDEAFAWLRWVDDMFSTFKEDSEISMIERGALRIDDASRDVREVLVRCAELADLTEGWFAAWAPRRGVRLDPSGLVKGWSIDRAGLGLELAGHRTFAVNGGGDILCSQHGAPQRPWRVGIRHPGSRDAIAAVLEVECAALATSGTYERGDHVWGRAGARSRDGLASVTIVGPELGIADALATAVFAEGSGSPRWLDRFPGYERLVITETGRVRWSGGLDHLLVR